MPLLLKMLATKYVRNVVYVMKVGWSLHACAVSTTSPATNRGRDGAAHHAAENSSAERSHDLEKNRVIDMNRKQGKR